MTAPRLRVASLLPSATEIVCALGAAEGLVGRSHECDHPSGVVAGLPALTRACFPDGTSREIDERVVDLVTRGLSLYDVDVARLREVAPDLVLTQDQCKVCAVPLADVEAALAELVGHSIEVLSLSPETLGDVFGDIQRVGDALERGPEAAALCTRLADRLAFLGERTGAIERPRVVCIEWIDPLMVAGNWTPELVRLAGGESQLARTGVHSPRSSFEALAQNDPDVIVVTACGFDLARTREELSPLLTHPGWAGLRAVERGRVALTDGNAYFNRSGPRLVDSAEILAEILHPALFDFGHRGRGWAPL